MSRGDTSWNGRDIEMERLTKWTEVTVRECRERSSSSTALETFESSVA